MADRQECPRCKGRGSIVLRVNWAAFVFWGPAILLKWPFFERETCPTCDGTGVTPWTVQ